MKILWYLSLLVVTCRAEDPVLATVTWDKQGGYDIVENQLLSGNNVAAWINFTNTINQTGWSYLEVKTNDALSDQIQAYAAGFGEGFITSKLIYMSWFNTMKDFCDGKGRDVLCKRIAQYLSKNTAWIEKKLSQNDKPKGVYWHQVDLFYRQLDGMTQGYMKAAQISGQVIPKEAIFWLNIFGDLEDLTTKFATKFNITDENGQLLGRKHGEGHCSALIKVLPGNKDLYAAHDTWNSYMSMIRVLKKYNLGFHMSDRARTPRSSKKGKSRKNVVIPGRVMSMSSYPGMIYSGDDFTLTSSGLAIIETTIGNSNNELWDNVKPQGQVLEGIRATIANRLARNGWSWTKIFSKRNSGTYNNQWMVVDYKRFKPGQELKRGLLWVLEQLPGHVHKEDLTHVLREQSYWPSYNSPYYQDIFNLSGNPALVEKYGDWFSYDKTPRALIFKRDQSNVQDLESMTKLMRYNNFKQDPLSACQCSPPFSGENAISARNDLNPKNGTYPFPSLAHRSHGGTDMKLTSQKMIKKLQFVAISGPTYDDLPPFQWSKADFVAADTPHMGHPDVWAFKPVSHQWQMA